MTGRQAIGFALGAATLVTAGLGILNRAAPPALPPGTVETAARAASGNVEKALELWLAKAQGVAASAAAVEPLNAAFSNHIDGASLKDLLQTEDWWSAYRSQFDTVQLRSKKVATISTGSLELLEDVSVIARAQTGESGARLVLTDRGPSLVAAAPLGGSAAGDGGVLVLSRPFTDQDLHDLAASVRAPLVLAREGLVTLRAGVTREAESALAGAGPGSGPTLDADGLGASVRVTVSPKLALWTWTSLGARPPAGHIYQFLLAISALCAVALAALLFMPRSRPQTASAAPSTVAAADVPEAIESKERTLPFGTPLRAGQGPVAASTTSRVIASAPRTYEVGSPVPAAPRSNDSKMYPGRTFGRYRLVERVGEGGMSEVYTAVTSGAEGFSRTFVVKRLRPEIAGEKEAVTQFIDEARTQSTLVHSNIVPVFDFGKIGNEYFMAMEYINGRNLHEISRACAATTGFCIDPRVVLYFAYETLQGLGFAHSRRDRDGQPLGIVHRDVSPSNVLVSAQGHVKLFDFGIAKANKRVTQTQAGTLKGNAVFMAPEQARGGVVDARSDLFSLGLVIYFCTVNTYLYQGANELDVLFRAACGLTDEDWARIAALPSPIPAILKKALATDPDQRFQTAEEFATELSPYVSGLQADAASLMELLFGEDLRRADALQGHGQGAEAALSGKQG